MKDGAVGEVMNVDEYLFLRDNVKVERHSSFMRQYQKFEDKLRNMTKLKEMDIRK
jgi:hypothetical protein